MSPFPGSAGAVEEETNVRVAARVRPLLPREQASNCCSCVTVQPGSNQLVVGTKRAFAFDVVFDIDATQSAVYDGCVASLLEGCFQGYNATILAYGQTGSGKTHTMGTGQAFAEDAEEGVTPKVIRTSFEYIEAHKHEVDFKVSCCYLEIYNEDLRDLLQPGGSKHLIAVREDASGGIKVSGIHAESCKSAQEMLRCLSDGSMQRTTGATLMNEMSSRSHSIFTLIVEQRRRLAPAKEPEGDPGFGVFQDSEQSYVTAKFHLVDLAGSERAKRTGAVGSRFKESVSINSGLLALGNVISALGDPSKRGSHVPYRESKLTRLLQDSLGGNSRTVMVACVSCADGDFEETLNTLKYAHRARNIKNKPVVNVDPRGAQLAAMQGEIEALRSQLQRVSEGAVLTPGSFGNCAPSSGVSAGGGEDLAELVVKLEASELRGSELAAEGEVLRRSLVDVYTTVCQHLPAIWQAPGGGESGGTTAAPGRQALTAVCEALLTTRRLLGDERRALGDLSMLGSPTGGGGERLQSLPEVQRLPPLSLLAGLAQSLDAGVERPSELNSSALDCLDQSVSGFLAEHLGDTAKPCSLSEMRRNSTMLIRKYLDEIKRLETEIAQYRRRTKQLQEELREAREDLQKDEDIFEEKMREMKDLQDRNEVLESGLRRYGGGDLSQALSDLGVGGDEVNTYAIELSHLGDAEGSVSNQLVGELGGFEPPEGEDGKRQELAAPDKSSQRIEDEMQALSLNVALKEDLIAELMRSEQEWGLAKAQYQERMERLQAELEETQRQLDALQYQLEESAELKEQAKQMEEERRRLERKVSEQVESLRKKQLEYSRLKEVRHSDGRRVKELEADVAHMRESQRELEKRQAEKRREAQQVVDLQRRLVREGQRVKDLEAENSRQREALRLRQTPQGPTASARQQSATPLSRKGSITGIERADRSSTGSCASRPSAAGASEGVVHDRGGSLGGGGGASSSSSSKWGRLEQQLDEHIRILEASQGLEEDLRKQDALLRKREQYLTYRRKISKDLSEHHEVKERLTQAEGELARVERDLSENAFAEPEARVRAEQRKLALKEELGELQRAMQKKNEGMSILHDIDERLEGLQDELDFRDARIKKAQQNVGEASASGPGSLDAELASLPAQDAKELLRRYCEKLVRLRQREKQHWQRLAASEAQLEERARQVAELQQVLRRQDSNSTKAIDKVTKEYEGRIRLLLRQLSAAESAAGAPIEGASSDAPEASSQEAPAGTGTSPAAELGEVEQLRKDNQYYKAMNRELKRRLRELLERGEVASSVTSAHPVEDLASQIGKLAKEKEEVTKQIKDLKGYASRFHNISFSAPGSENAAS